MFPSHNFIFGGCFQQYWYGQNYRGKNILKLVQPHQLPFSGVELQQGMLWLADTDGAFALRFNSSCDTTPKRLSASLWRVERVHAHDLSKIGYLEEFVWNEPYMIHQTTAIEK